MAKVNSKDYFSQEAQERISNAVRDAEGHTSGEIVPVLATTSDSYERGLFMASLTLAALATLLILGCSFLPWALLFSNDETYVQYGPLVPVLTLAVVQLITLVVGYRLATGSSGLHRAFIPHAVMQERVTNAAHQAFHKFKLTHTADATGIMIYVSLFERSVLVLADQAINEKHDQSTWDEVRDVLVKGIKEDDAEAGFVNAIQKCGKILAADFPIQPDDTNELPNHLRLV